MADHLFEIFELNLNTGHVLYATYVPHLWGYVR